MLTGEEPTAPWCDTPPCPSCKAGPVFMSETGAGELLEPQPFCLGCEEWVTLTPAGLARAVASQAWADMPGREQAWAEVLRLREVDRVAAEHAARQLPIFQEGTC